jgi:type II secretory pathway component PulF
MLSQAIAAKLSLPDAMQVASKMMRGFPLGDLLSRAAEMVRLGEEVPDSLRWAGMTVHADIQAAFKVGEYHGNLGGELAAASRRLDARVADHLAAAIGRRRTARRFAQSLARLLAREPLTFDLVHDAARLVGARDRQFRRVIRWLALGIEGGLPFADALASFPKVFDLLFVRCVENAQSREQMRSILSRIGSDE